MKRTLILIAAVVMTTMAWAVPARREPFNVVQPNGDTLSVRLVGDERWHAHFTEDGYLIQQNEKGYYCYAKWGETYTDKYGIERRKVVVTRKKAHNEGARCACEKRWLKKNGGK